MIKENGSILIPLDFSKQSLSAIKYSYAIGRHTKSKFVLMHVYQKENESGIVPTHIRNIADVSGAGDTVIAVASLVYAATKNVQLMAEVANIAGGLVCEEVGTAAIDKEKLLKECKLLLK